MTFKCSDNFLHPGEKDTRTTTGRQRSWTWFDKQKPDADGDQEPKLNWKPGWILCFSLLQV